MRYPKRSQYKYAKSQYRVRYWADYVVALLVVVCLTAAYLPSRRIVRLHPMTVLKSE
jgi:ABC-type lipoprotein release transport system permease subunit